MKTEQTFVKKRDICIIAGVLLAALVAWLLLQSRGTGAVARVTVGLVAGEQEVFEIALAEDGIHHIEASLPVTLEVAGGRIRFINSVCPDHVCENMGWQERDNDWASCVPAGVSVKIVG